jgi:hypothetical protein
VRTNESGRYEFRGVADGQHRVTVNADNLPLPWFIESADRDEMGMAFAAKVEVKVRATTQLDIAASR